MTSYCQYNNAFSNVENDNLDYLARQINDKHKKINKNTQNSFKNKMKENCIGIECLLDSSNERFAPQNLENDISYFSAQGDFSSGLPTPFEKQINKKKNKDKYKDKDYDSSEYTNKSNKSFTSEKNGSSIIKLDTDISSNYSSLPPKIKKQVRLNTTHLKKYTDDDDKIVINHMKDCKQCKKQIMNIINSTNHSLQNINQDQNTDVINFNTSELKGVLILVLVGVFIIIIFDIFIRK